jgi:hypothetical protein
MLTSPTVLFLELIDFIRLFLSKALDARDDGHLSPIRGLTKRSQLGRAAHVHDETLRQALVESDWDSLLGVGSCKLT